jgi:hypothetical protein
MNKNSERGMMPTTDPNALTHYLAWDYDGRQGQKCRIVEYGWKSRTARVQFEDGLEMVVNRQALRQNKVCT